MPHPLIPHIRRKPETKDEHPLQAEWDRITEQQHLAEDDSELRWLYDHLRSLEARPLPDEKESTTGKPWAELYIKDKQNTLDEIALRSRRERVSQEVNSLEELIASGTSELQMLQEER